MKILISLLIGAALLLAQYSPPSGGGGGSPGGPNKAVQINDSGSFGGNSGFTFDKVTGTVAIGATLLVGPGVKVAYVETWGNDSTGAIGQAHAPYATIDAALTALASGPAVIRLGLGTFAHPHDDSAAGSKLFSNLAIVGTARPDFNSGNTGLTNGSIVVGPLVFDTNLRSNIHLADFGVDSGSAVCTANYSGVAQAGLNFFNIGQVVASATTGIVLQNLIAITQSASAAVHSIAVENVMNPSINGLTARFGQHGITLKTVGGTISNLSSAGNSGEGVIFKKDTYALAGGTAISGVHVEPVTAADTATCFSVQSNASGDALIGLGVAGLTCTGTTNGVQFVGLSNANVTYVQVSGFSYSGVTNPIVYDANTEIGTVYVNLTNVQGTVVGSPGTSGPQWMPINDSTSWVSQPKQPSNTEYLYVAPSQSGNSAANSTLYVSKTGFGGANAVPSDREFISFGFLGQYTWAGGQVATIEAGAAGTGVQNPIGIRINGAFRTYFPTDGGIQLVTATQPTCDATHRGTLFYVAGGTGVADTNEICRKDAADAYAWVTLF